MLLFQNSKNINKCIKVFIIGIISFFGIFLNISSAYYFGLKSADNTATNIVEIEEQLDVHLPIVSFIFDPREKNDVLNSIDRIVDLLGNDRIYHFTISPDNYSADEVVMGAFDEQYKAFFKKVKEKNLHVIFRTMHEMNGGWYAWGSNPEKFKAAWIHIRSLSRAEGLTQENIAFDFSVNHWDMPTNETPSQSAPLIECRVGKSGCWHFEDYYPGDEFVDVVGFSFYNWGKASSNRQWLSPEEILYDKNWKTYERIQAFNKPVIIDEVATTAVWYTGSYNYEKSRIEYENNEERKNYWLSQLGEFLNYHPELLAAIYFNTDYTHGLAFQIVGEADWAIVNLDDGIVYDGFRGLDLFGEKDLTNILKTLFGVEKVSVDGSDIYVSSKFAKEVRIVAGVLDRQFDDNEDKLDIIKKLELNMKSKTVMEALKKLKTVYGA